MKLIIAEDEILCRKNLTSINWSALDVELAGIAKDGAEALDLSKQIKPDILISDIEMPKMTGIELAGTLSNILPEIKIIILTAYNKFEYVQESVSLGIFEYILKPFEDETLTSSVERAVSKLKAERVKKLENESISRRLDMSKYFLKNYFFNCITNASEQKVDLLSVFGTLNASDKYIAMVISLENASSENIFAANYTLFQNILDVLKKHNADIIPFFDVSTLTFLFSFDKTEPDTKISARVLSAAEAVCEYLNFCNTDRYVIGIGKCSNGPENAAYSYKGAVSALEYSFYLGFNTIICIDDVEPKYASETYVNIYDSGFLSHVKVGNFEAACIQLKKIFNAFRSDREDIATVQRTCNEIFSQLSLCLIQCGLNPKTLFDKTDSWTVIQKYQTIDELEKFLVNIVDVTISHINFTIKRNNGDLVEQVKAYIQKKPATSLNDIAEHFYHSPNYLSSIFHKETETTIKNYIIQSRIEIAQKLLRETTDSIYKIANAVGYKNPQHFSMLFKSKTGISPTAYQANFHK